MKTAIVIYATMLLIVGCISKKELTKEEALSIIKKEIQYPKTVDYDIYCSDPELAKKVLAAKLEETGMVTVQRTQKLADAGKPLITLTGKAEQFLLPTPEKDKAIDVQKVKLAEEDLIEITKIATEESGKNALIEYTVGYKNITPFAALVTINFKANTTRKASILLKNENWELKK